MTEHYLLVPDLDGLRRKLVDAPSALLGRLHERFRDRLCWDSEFRRHNIFLSALLGDSNAIAEAKGLIFPLALHSLILTHDRASHRCRTDALGGRDAHVWCVAPRGMRVAAYFTWLDAHGAWTAEERRIIGNGVLDFFSNHVIPVLRARTPAGHNQQLSMTLGCAVAGHAFADVDGVAERAAALRDWALPKVRQTLGLMPASGYSGEGSTYQSDVVSPLVMWAGVFLRQLGMEDAWTHRWSPNGACLADTLKMEAAMGGCGGLLPPWDHYGWAYIHNLAARALWADLSHDPALLPLAETVWDASSSIAWRPDDRMWTLIYWPEGEWVGQIRPGSTAIDCNRPQSTAAVRGHDDVSSPAPAPGTVNAPVLTGWSLPAVGAAIEHQSLRLRAMCVWDRCAGSLQGVCRGQVNPNHLIIDLDGEPITADGWEDGRERLVSDASVARTLETLTPSEQELIAQQYGSVETWVQHNQHGFLGQSCAIVVDGWESYFPRQAREGRLVFEQREAERQTVAGEAAAYYQPAFDVTRMRRTVSMSAAGTVWIVDDARADSAHDFTWRLWLRRGAHAMPSGSVRLEPATGQRITLAWWISADDAPVPVAPRLTTVPTFPQGRGDRYPWTDEGSDRCDVTAAGRKVRFVACLVPGGVDDLYIRETAPNVWEALWNGGQESFSLPDGIDAVADDAPVTGAQISESHAVNDLNEEPFALLDEPVEALLCELDDPPVDAWRRTGAVMQTLTERGCAAALPRIEILLRDARQNYAVHSVAAWCLGRARHTPAIETLRRMSGIPEDNTAARCRWAVERMEARDEQP